MKNKINIFSLLFLSLYIKHFFKHLPTFFKTVPWHQWYLFIKSSNKVAYETSKCIILINREPDIWSANAKRSKFIKHYKEILNK